MIERQGCRGTWRWLVHEDSGSETEGMTTEVADEHSVYIECLGGRYIWDEAHMGREEFALVCEVR